VTRLFAGYGVSQVRKAIGVAVAGTALWAGQVVASTPAHVTAPEWVGLGGIGLAVLACFGLTNDPPSAKP
jgi:hypothetical protein